MQWCVSLLVIDFFLLCITQEDLSSTEKEKMPMNHLPGPSTVNSGEARVIMIYGGTFHGNFST